MSREIKFRAWDKQRKEWVKQTGNPYIFPFEGRVSMKCWGDSTGHISDIDYSEFYELQQFTGLKDKNGNQIYEGDIVAGWNGTIVGSVFYQAPSFVIKKSERTKSWNAFDIHPDDNQLYVVVGNIHENGDLLK